MVFSVKFGVNSIRLDTLHAASCPCKQGKGSPVTTQADRAALAEVRAEQQRVKLEDDVAAEAVKEAARAAAENVLERGLECLKRRTRERDYSEALQARPPSCWQLPVAAKTPSQGKNAPHAGA